MAIVYALVRIDAGHPLAGDELWEAVDMQEPANPVTVGLYDDAGNRVHITDGTWTFIRDDIPPPFLQG